MSNNIDSATRAPFFPNSRKAATTNAGGAGEAEQVSSLKRNAPDKASEIKGRTAQDARVEIPDSIRDFSRIKKAADSAQPIDNSEKIARLKAQIQNGTYNIDYDGVAEKILTTEY